MIPHWNDWRRWFNELSKCEVTRERNFDSCKKRWFAGNLKSSSQASKCSNFFTVRTLPLSRQCGQYRPYLTAFPLSSHLVVGTDGDIIEHFGSRSCCSLTRGRSFHLLTIFETPGTTLSLQPQLVTVASCQYPRISHVTEQERLHFRWGHAFSSLEMFLESGAGVFKGNSLGPRSGPRPHVTEWCWAQCRPVVGPVHGG